MNKSEERLIELLEEKNFKGMDASIEESLLFYVLMMSLHLINLELLQ